MKKSYLMIAAAGLIMAACSQEDDFVAQNAAAEQGDGAVLFDTYLSNNTTRAGQTGTMTTSTLQSTGFGIVAMTHAITGITSPTTDFTGYADNTYKPEFMWNQYVSYEASNWVYTPLKYWPNETTNDQQSAYSATENEQEGVSFFAYAPYVTETSTAGTDPFSGYVDLKNKGDYGLLQITNNSTASNARIHYQAVATDVPSKNVDLLWGVSSGFTYHPVKTNSPVIKTAGLPILNMMKPALEEKIKFDFKHALARIGMKIVGAFDQVAQGGSLDQHTRVTVKEIEVEGAFDLEGVLDLNNTIANQARWLEAASGFVAKAHAGTLVKHSIKMTYNGTNTEMNPEIKWTGTAKTFPAYTGVRPTEKDVISITNTYDPVTVAANTPANGTTYYSDANGSSIVQPAYSGAVYTYDEDGYTVAASPTINGTKYYKFTLKDGQTGTDGGSCATGTKWYTNEGVYTATPSTGTNYYQIDQFNIEEAVPVYTGGNYYTLKTTPGYFLVIPQNANAAPEDLTVTVKIKYAVTTRDPNLDGGASEIENYLKQDVVLKDFTNGKSYLLKLILGLTSVKVDAEVSNWEVGTVESNLPQNLE